MSGTADYRLHRIEAVTGAVLAHLDVEDLLVELLDRVRELLAVETATVLLLDAFSQQLVVTASRGIEAAVRQGIRIPMGKGFAGRVAAEKRGTVRVHMELQLPDVLVTVRDMGRWRQPCDEGRGRGTLFMRNCSDDLRIDHGPTGTSVVIRRSLAE